MASALYPNFKEALLGADVDLASDNIKVVLVDTADYTYSSAHEDLADVPSGARVATSGNLTNKSITNGVFDAGDVTLTSVTGDPAEALILYQDTGVEGTSLLIAYIDGISVTPNGGDIEIEWHSSGIFAI